MRKEEEVGTMKTSRKIGFTRLQSIFAELFGLSRAVSLSVVLVLSLGVLFAVFWFFYSAPPSTIIMTAGPQDSVFQVNAEKYAKILARNHVKLKILQSEGSLENLKRLADPKFKVDVGFVQGGVSAGTNIENLVSLGSVAYQSMLIFYRSAAPVELLSQFQGKRLAIGPEGSGTRMLALVLLKANGVEPGGATTLSDLDADDAEEALLYGRIDAAFMMGDNSSRKVMHDLLLAPDVRLFDFTQAAGYTRRIGYLNKLEMPKGSIDFGKDIPPSDIHLIGPTVEFIARTDLHPALSDLLIEAAQEVHEKAGVFKRQGEFPSPVEHEFPLSADAVTFLQIRQGLHLPEPSVPGGKFGKPLPCGHPAGSHRTLPGAAAHPRSLSMEDTPDHLPVVSLAAGARTGHDGGRCAREKGNTAGADRADRGRGQQDESPGIVRGPVLCAPRTHQFCPQTTQEQRARALKGYERSGDYRI
jgi:TRAP-type uncharacterized transport system substrate-binding protein